MASDVCLSYIVTCHEHVVCDATVIISCHKPTHSNNHIMRGWETPVTSIIVHKSAQLMWSDCDIQRECHVSSGNLAKWPNKWESSEFLSQHMMGKFFALFSLSLLPNLYQHSHNYPPEIFHSATFVTQHEEHLARADKCLQFTLDNLIKSEQRRLVSLSQLRQEGNASVALRRWENAVTYWQLTHSVHS